MRFGERLNDLHLAATLRTGRLPFLVSRGCRGVFRLERLCGRGNDLLLRSRRQKLTDAGEFCLPMAVGKKAVMAEALETVGQNMEQKPADELGWCKRHELDARAVAVILPGEADAFVGDSTRR